MTEPVQPGAPQPPSERLAFVRGGAFSLFQVLGWAAVMFNGCVAVNCQDMGAGDNLGAGFALVLAVALFVLVGAVASVGAGAASMLIAGRAQSLRWVGTALVCLGLIAGVAGGTAVRSSLCRYVSGRLCP